MAKPKEDSAPAAVTPSAEMFRESSHLTFSNATISNVAGSVVKVEVNINNIEKPANSGASDSQVISNNVIFTRDNGKPGY